jgi:hypothetical protein
VPYLSGHSPHTFSNIIDGALVRAVRYSSTLEAFNNERRYIELKSLSNGFHFSSSSKLYFLLIGE